MSSTSVLSENLPPLAERIRPQVLGDFIGQEKLLMRSFEGIYYIRGKRLSKDDINQGNDI